MDTIDVVVETPGGSGQKFNFDPQTHFFKLKKILPQGMVFPYDFGFIPGTKGEDGDPLDILIMAEFNCFPGCLVTARIIGAIRGKQTEPHRKRAVRNDRFIAIPETSLLFKKVRDIRDLPAKLVEEVQSFFC